MAKLVDLAKVLRSKNSGPFEITLDVLFDDEATYRRVIESGALSRDIVASLYGLDADKIVTFALFDAALGLKITYLRDVSSGTFADRDVYGAQQHAPLMNIEIPDHIPD